MSRSILDRNNASMDVLKYENFLRNNIVPQFISKDISIAQIYVISEWYQRLDNCPKGIIEWMIEDNYLLNVGTMTNGRCKYTPNVSLITLIFQYQIKLANQRFTQK